MGHFILFAGTENCYESIGYALGHPNSRGSAVNLLRERRITLQELASHAAHVRHKQIGNVLTTNSSDFQWLPDKSIDLVLTDPPFNIARDTNFHTYEKNTINSYRFDQDKGWDSHSSESFIELMEGWALEFNRVLKPGGNFAIFCADEYLSDLIRALKKAGLKPRRTLTWQKPNAVPINRGVMMMSACEYVVTGVKGGKAVFNADLKFKLSSKMVNTEIVHTANKASWSIEQAIRKELETLPAHLSRKDLQNLISQIIVSTAKEAATKAVKPYSSETEISLCVPNAVSFNSKAGSRLHPTEKPVTILEYLINLFSNPDSLILDPFSGSASLGEAALRTGRKAVLVEQDKEFYSAGKIRLAKMLDKI